MQNKELLNISDMLNGEINRMCVTDDVTELYNMALFAKDNIERLLSLRIKMMRGEQE